MGYFAIIPLVDLYAIKRREQWLIEHATPDEVFRFRRLPVEDQAAEANSSTAARDDAWDAERDNTVESGA